MIDFYNDEYFMKEALKEARKAFEMDEVPVGAVVVCGTKIIARGHNMTEKLNDSTAHAEMLAITSATSFLGSKYLKECTLYVTLEPCVMCAGALFWSQIGKIVFGAPDSKRGYSLISREITHPKTQIVGGILQQESTDLLKEFFKKKRVL